MRYRILASFQGAPYEAGVGPDESDVVLFAACPPPEEAKFEPATGHWRKRVNRADVQTLYESRPVGMFRGERCIVLDDLNDRLHIVYLGHDALRAAQLGYWEVDRGVFELITPRHEVTDIVEQRLPLPLRSDSGQHTRPGSLPSDSTGDSQPFGYGTGGQDEFATGPQFFGQRASLDALPPSYWQDPPITGLPRSQPTVAKPVDQSEVSIPPVPEPPLPLEAEALRAASSAARRGQKSSQSRSASPTAPAQAPVKPIQATSAPAEATLAPVNAAAAPANVVPTPVSPAATPPQAPVKEVADQVPTAEVSQPLPAPMPAAATLTKAAMLSHAAGTAARQAASSKQADPSSPPTTASGDSSTRSDQESDPRAEIGTEAEPAPAPAPAMALRQGAEPEQPDSAPEPASLVPEPGPLAPEPAPFAPAPFAPAPFAPAQVVGPAKAEAVADSPSMTAPATPTPSATPTTSTHPDDDGPASPQSAELAPVQPAEPVPTQSAQAAPDRADGTLGTPLAGISDPPSVAHPPAASAVPSWVPQGPVQPQPGYDAAPGQTDYFAPYVPSESVPRNGTAVNGTAAAVDLGLTTPMPIEQPDLPPLPTLLSQPQPLKPSDAMAEPAQAEADPGPTTRRRRSTKRRLPTQKIFSDLATQAAIPAAAYAIGEDIDGAMCLVRTDEGFEVFNAVGGARHEVRVFQDEESAYFYLFGVLVAESVRTGALVPRD